METQNILEMEVVVEHIFNFLSVEDLKRARLVCRLWSFEGAKKILPNGYFRVPLGFHKQDQKQKEEEEKLIFNFLHPQLNQDNQEPRPEPEPGHSKKYDRALKLRQLPSVWISNVKDIKILHRLGVLSGNVKTLRFPYFNEFETDEENEELQKSFKNLLSRDLTSLSTFYFHGSNPYSILSDYMPSWDIAKLLVLNKGHLIKSVHFSFYWRPMICEQEIDIYEALLETTPALSLKSIVFGEGINLLRQQQQHPGNFSRAINLLNKVFASNAASLREIKVMDTLADIMELEIPTLPNLTTLTVLLPSRNRAKFQLFPNLETAESSRFPNLSMVKIGIVGNYQTGCESFEAVSSTDKKTLLPDLNPSLKFLTVEYLYKRRHRFSFCSKNFALLKESIESVSRDVESLERKNEETRERLNFRFWHTDFPYMIGLLIVVCLVYGVFYFVMGFIQQMEIDKAAPHEISQISRQQQEIEYVVKGRFSNRICVGKNATWKSPPVFACPIITAVAHPTESDSDSDLALNLRQFWCKDVALYYNNTVQSEILQENGTPPLDFEPQYHLFLSHEKIPRGFRIFSPRKYFVGTSRWT